MLLRQRLFCELNVKSTFHICLIKIYLRNVFVLAGWGYDSFAG